MVAFSNIQLPSAIEPSMVSR